MSTRQSRVSKTFQPYSHHVNSKWRHSTIKSGKHIISIKKLFCLRFLSSYVKDRTNLNMFSFNNTHCSIWNTIHMQHNLSIVKSNVNFALVMIAVRIWKSFHYNISTTFNDIFLIICSLLVNLLNLHMWSHNNNAKKDLTLLLVGKLQVNTFYSNFIFFQLHSNGI